MNTRRRLTIAGMIHALALGGAALAHTGREILDAVCSGAAPPSFGMRYGNAPRGLNGGQGRGAVARSKRAARKRRNVSKHPRGAA